MVTRRTFLGMAAAAPIGARMGWALPASVNGPRLFLNAARLEQAKALSRGPLALAWKKMQAQCDRIVELGKAKYSPPTPRDGEMLWERVVGNGLATLAMGYLLSGNEMYKRFAFDQARDACGYELWGGPDASKEGKDLAAGHLLFGLGILLDWLGEEMDEATRGLILDTLKRRGTQMAEGVKSVYWARTLLQNHLWVNMTGLLTTALALQRYDAAAAHPLIVTAAQQMQPCFPVLAPDGSDQEGPGYWTYGAEYLLKYHHLATELLGMKIDSPWLHETQNYCIALTLPLASVTKQRSIFDIADSLMTPYYGPEYLLRRLAALNRSTTAQEMANRLEQLGAVEPAAPWLNFVWYDPAVPSSGLAGLPTQHYFPDLDLVVARSDRSGSEAAVVMRAGPPLGKKVQAMHIPHDIGTAHTHPDVNHITLFGAGEFLLMDNGYASLKDTHQHNTLIVNGKGQVGSGAQWTKWPSYPVPDPQPALKDVSSQPAFDYWVGEGAAAYPASCGLTKFDRHVLFVKPDVLVVIDDLEASAMADFELLWHPGAQPKLMEAGEYSARVKGADLRMQFVLPPSAELMTGTRPYPTHEKGDHVLNEVSVKARGTSALTGAIFKWSGGERALPQAELSEKHGVWTVRSGGKTVALDVARRRVSVA